MSETTAARRLAAVAAAHALALKMSQSSADAIVGGAFGVSESAVASWRRRALDALEERPKPGRPAGTSAAFAAELLGENPSADIPALLEAAGLPPLSARHLRRLKKRQGGP